MRDEPEQAEIRDRGARRRRPGGRAPHAARSGADAGLHPAGDQGDGARARVSRGRRARLRADPRQHLPPVRLAGARADRRRRRPARVHGLGAGADHRLRRLSGLLAGPRRRRQRGQGQGAARGRPRLGGLDRARRACASAPTGTAPSCSSRPRSRCRCRRRSAPTSPSSSTSARPSTPTASTPPARPSARTAGSTAASSGTARRPGAPGGLRDRPGRRPRGPAPRVGPGRLRRRRRRARDRRHPRPRQGGDARACWR